MAKDLQWFKFVISEWITGDIQLVSYAAKGLFTDIMAHYWSKEGDVTLKKLYKHFPVCLNGGDQHSEIFQELINEDCVKIDGDNIRISFMDEQSDKWKDLSVIKSEAGSKGGRGVKAGQKQPESTDKASTKAEPKQADSKHKAIERKNKILSEPTGGVEKDLYSGPNREPSTAQTSPGLASVVASTDPKTIQFREDFFSDIEGYKFKQSELAEMGEEFNRIPDADVEACYLQFRRKWKTEEGRKKTPKARELIDLLYSYGLQE